MPTLKERFEQYVREDALRWEAAGTAAAAQTMILGIVATVLAQKQEHALTDIIHGLRAFETNARQRNEVSGVVEHARRLREFLEISSRPPPNAESPEE